MQPDHYKAQLLAYEWELSNRIERSVNSGRDPGDESVEDVGDASVADELKDGQFTTAGADREVLIQVQDALERIEAGTFGVCVIGGEPIEEARLEAMPWTPYCMKHQKAREKANPPRTPTL